jgi:hypothetical protein
MFDVVSTRAKRARTAAGRATLAPLLTRAGIFLCGLMALSVAYPTDVVASELLLALLVIALIPALAPRGRGATAAALLTVAGWIVDTTWYNHDVVLWRVITIASMLYLAHTLTALAAVLPYDATVEVDVVSQWLARAFAVVLASAVLTVIVLAVTSELAGPAFLVATLVGLGAAVGVTALLGKLLRRP